MLNGKAASDGIQGRDPVPGRQGTHTIITIMGDNTMPTLTDAAVRNAKPRPKPYRLSDGDSLYLLVNPSGVKVFQYRYYHGICTDDETGIPKLNKDGKPIPRQMTATLGKYPAISLADARQKARDARKLADAGQHVTAARNVARAKAAVSTGNTFKVMAAAWVADTARGRAWSEDHKDKVVASLSNHLSRLDNLPVTAITALMCDPELRKVEASAPDAARKVYQRLQSILDYAVSRGFIERNPLPATRRGPRADVKHFPAVLSAMGLGEILRNAERANVAQGVQRAHLLCAFTAQRIGEVVGADWTEVDFQTGTWTIPRARMKRHDPNLPPHVVPLPPELFTQMREWHRIDQGAGYVCGSPTTGSHISREAVEKFYNRTLKLAGIHSPHSWRSVFSTFGRNAGKDRDAIEKQLDHAIGSDVSQAYDRADRLAIRREIVNAHEQALIAARDGAQIFNIAERRA
jgi:integrase